ncbi:hypothetical protein ABBQ32_009078 [Trebouxia sp. C0010 RCD-2024]
MERMASAELESEHSRRYRNSLEGTSGRLSHYSNSSPVDFEQQPTSFKSKTTGQHDITIGKPDKSTVDLLEEVPLENQLYLEYRNVRAWVPAMAPGGGGILPGIPKFTLPSFKSNKTKQTEAPAEKDKMRQILFNITGCCRPKEVLALMGPSGSGKTTLLSIMGSRAQSAMRRTGAITFNGQKLNKRFKRQLGFVMQDDLLYESLTVYETLYYAAMLRLPQHMDHNAKTDRVDTVIAALGLVSCKDTIIGGFFRKGISGGERKRASIGHELLINPSILLLDEPTSGLDSTTAMHLLQLLRQLSQGGRAIVTTIHQPSSRLYQQLDKLLLLSQGHALYYGRGDLADDFFDKLGYRLPYRVNVADFILDLASADVYTATRDGEASRSYLITCTEAYLEKHPNDGYDPSNPGTTNLSWLRPSVDGRGHHGENGSVEHLPPPLEASHQEEDAEGEDDKAGPRGADIEQGPTQAAAVPQSTARRWGATYPSQIRILFIRSVRTRRFQTLSTQDLCQFLIVGVLSGLFWLQRAKSDTTAAAADTLGLLFFELLFLSFRQLFVALFTFPDEFKMLLKERASGMYRLSAFYFARTASDLPMDMAIPTLFLLLVYFMGHLRYTAAAFFANFFTVILVMLVAQSYGLLLGTIVMVPKTAQTLAAILMLTFILTGGYFVRGIPVWISWLKYLSFVFYGYGQLAHIEFKDRQLYSCTDPSGAAGAQASIDVDNPRTDPRCTPVSNTQSALGLQQGVNSQVWKIINPCILILTLFVLRALVYIALRKKTSRV